MWVLTEYLHSKKNEDKRMAPGWIYRKFYIIFVTGISCIVTIQSYAKSYMRILLPYAYIEKIYIFDCTSWAAHVHWTVIPFHHEEYLREFHVICLALFLKAMCMKACKFYEYGLICDWLNFASAPVFLLSLRTLFQLWCRFCEIVRNYNDALHWAVALIISRT